MQDIHTTVIQTKDKKLTTDAEIFKELDETWGKKYYSKEPCPLPEWFLEKYVRPLRPAHKASTRPNYGPPVQSACRFVLYISAGT